MAKKAKVVKAKVTKVRRRKRVQKSKGAEFPWEVWTVCHRGYYSPNSDQCFEEKKEAEDWIREHPEATAPVIVHVEIPPTEY